MNDPRTQEALESLADLFLTQAMSGRPRPEADQSQAEQGEAEQDPAVEQVIDQGLQKPRPGQAPLDGPSPIRLAPKLASRPPAAPAGGSADPFGEDPDFNPYPRAVREEQAPALRLTGDEEAEADHAPKPSADADAPRERAADESDPASDPSPPAAMVEAVILGHLPGLAGPWLTQYAQLLADQTGPVLIIHVDEEDAAPGNTSAGASGGDPGRIDLELVEPNDQEVAPVRGSVRVPPRPQTGTGSELALGMIDAMVRARVGKVSTILVHLEADADPKRLSRLLAIDDWTLLTGSEDFAVAGASALLAKLAEADQRVTQRQVALMVMGAEIRAADTAARQITQSMEGLMQRPAMSLGCHPRLGPVNVRQLGSFGGLGRLWPQLVAYFEDLEAPQTPMITESDAPASVIEPQPETTRAEAATAPSPRQADGAPATGSATVTAPLTPRRAAVSPTSRVAARGESEPPRLAELVAAGAHGITGGIALEARCPYQPLTELVLDEAGRLHLLRREVPVAVHGSEAEAKAQHDAGIRAAIVDLVEARKWVREHLALLKLTLRDANFDADADPTMHLFTGMAHLATPLVAKLGDQVRLHLLQEVHIGRESTWFTTPLN